MQGMVAGKNVLPVTELAQAWPGELCDVVPTHMRVWAGVYLEAYCRTGPLMVLEQILLHASQEPPLLAGWSIGGLHTNYLAEALEVSSRGARAIISLDARAHHFPYDPEGDRGNMMPLIHAPRLRLSCPEFPLMCRKGEFTFMRDMVHISARRALYHETSHPWFLPETTHTFIGVEYSFEVAQLVRHALDITRNGPPAREDS